MKKDYSRRVSLPCPLCANTLFEFDDDKVDGPLECIDCKSTFTRDEIIENNQVIIPEL